MKQAAQDADAYGKAVASVVGPLEARAFALEAELQNYGLTQSQIERTTLARYEEVRALAAANGATQAYLSTLDREIEARRRIAEASAGLEAADANKRAAAQAAQDWQRTADAIEKSLIDALMEGGKSGAEYIEGLFRSMVLRPIIKPSQPVAGGITSHGLAEQGRAAGWVAARGGEQPADALWRRHRRHHRIARRAAPWQSIGSSARRHSARPQGHTAAGLAGPRQPAPAADGYACLRRTSVGRWRPRGRILFGAFDKKPSDKRPGPPTTPPPAKPSTPAR